MKFLLVALLAAFLVACRTNESPEGQANDLQITAQVKSKLASEVGLSTVPNISVNSTNGVVTARICKPPVGGGTFIPPRKTVGAFLAAHP